MNECEVCGIDMSKDDFEFCDICAECRDGE